MDVLSPLFELEKIEINDGWTLVLYKEFKAHFLDENDKLTDNSLEKFSYFQGANFQNFRVQQIFKATPFLIGYFYDTKEIRIYTPRLGQELFLVQAIEKSKSYQDNLNLDEDRYVQFKKHTEMAASLKSRKFPSTIERITKKYDLHDFLSEEDTSLNEKTKKLVGQLLVHLNQYKPSFFERISDFGLGLTAQYALLRIHLLKFLAILPSLDHDLKGDEVKRILLESLRRLLEDSKKAKSLKKKGQEAPLPGLYLILTSLVYYIASFCPAGPLAWLVRFKVRFMAKRFIAGETIETAEQSFKSLKATNRDVTLDQLGELVVSEAEADSYCAEVLKLIEGFSLHIDKGEKNGAGINRAHVSIKVSALCSDFKPHAFDYTYEYVAPRLKKILLAAKERDVFLNIDAEHYDYRDIVFKVYRKVLLETPELSDFEGTGIVLQAYLRDAYRHLKEIIELAKERGLNMPVRLVKGAYWDAETVEADAHSFDAPEFLNKEETDLHFRQLIIKIYEAHPHLQLCLASHNFEDHCFAEVLRTEKYPDLPPIEHQCLHMTYEALSMAMAKMGWAVRNYVPIGSLIVGMAYLVRRIMENSSQVGVLTIMRSHKKQRSMKRPSEIHREKKEQGELSRELTASHLTSEFFNVAPVRLYRDRERSWVEESYEAFSNKLLGKTYSNQFKLAGEQYQVLCSSDPKKVVGSIKFANREETTKAISLIDEAYNEGSWAKNSWAIRANIFLKAASLMLMKRNELAALISYEAGKSVVEALGDVDEAVDFLNFYVREEERIFKHNPKVISRGAMAVIAPWNFPLAIPCGMVASCLIAGNTAILKSAEQTPLIAQVLVDILHEAGVPQNVLIHLPGDGETVGDELVRHERIAGIVFTGSKNVGLHIAKTAGKRVYENKLFNLSYPVKVITEMGGKNAVIVTANAELDETVSGILYSSFAHAGQKCSAASRVLVDNSVKARLLERLKEACLDIRVGESYDFATAINPIVTKEDCERLQKATLEIREELKGTSGEVVVDRSKDDLPGFCVGPVLVDMPTESALDPNSYAVRELFGPIVHIIGFDSLDEALKIYNGTDYALTGGIFSQSQDDIDYLTKNMESGNIYVNRTITGARVAIEPFGGFKLSGTGPKAGGKDYLTSFHLNRPYEMDFTDGSREEGSSYHFELCRPSLLRSKVRIARVCQGLETTIRHFESLFEGIYGRDKETLNLFKKWAQKNLYEFQYKEHSNRKIPGQLSFNDYSLTKNHALVVAYNEKPTFAILMQTLAGMMMGVGVTVAARNQKSYEWWSFLRDFFYQAGISKENFDVYFSNEELLQKKLQNSYLDTVIVDGGLERVRNVLDLCYRDTEEKQEEKRVKNILSHFDSVDVNDFKRLCLNYVQVRAFAINTMRHGAPLELDF